MELFYSIQELVELQSSIQNPKYPNNRQGFEYRAKKENWDYSQEKSIGRNGFTRKYMIPVDLALSIHNYLVPNIKNEVEATHELAVTQNATDLMSWQREIAENRLFVVRYIQQQIKQGTKKTPAIEQFIADAEELLLPEEMQLAVQKANAKAGEGRTVSRRSVFDWVKSVEEAEQHKINVISVLAPKARRSDIPVWAMDLLKVYAQPQKPTLAAVLELLPNYLKEGVPCPTYNQAYRFIKEKLGNVEAQRGRMGNREL